MIPVWDDKYSIGNNGIDKQHKKLFELAKKAYIYANKNISRDDIRNIITEFFEYMKEHFRDEEVYMELIEYPYLEQHAAIHKDIISSMSNLIKTAKNVNDLKENLVVIAEKWLLEHILHHDIRIEEWRKLQLNNPNKPSTTKKYKYTCGCPNKIHIVSIAIHNKIIKGKKYSCMICNSEIKIKD
ncbi:bacteriohemerythrin [Campylobacter fetus]|uniref:bacteriohemerythrin n=1 Tax=Campylobacter fetus TaxID=196 RepID=UPI0008188298|nr:bacteriohemerythrin [Campylobacter fetus]AVK81897.1 hemerythrin family non-heme iron protein [Campylobacter fetus subsp. testudinum]MPB72063.1 bacteriohemerythrin [Campylobacter fetus]MPB78139.1 bacteriohemerythrin [Campylobacter fetus]OCR86935.1 hemerythrin family non-heme iron protein [Campylobacter fetus subsp. testudinum]OCR92476.1 hemerythrin family non-heme iron protein [Campylobacter fetus subsp. testudinum]